MSDLNEMLENAMKDPRFSGILASLKEKADSGEIDVGSILGSIGAKDGGSQEREETTTEQKAAPRVGMDSHKKLLAALRPYLGEEKRGAVDGILKIGEFSGIIEALRDTGKGGR